MKEKKYIASVSFGKDSLAMLLLLIEKRYPLDEVVFYDTGKEFQAVYNLRDKIKLLLTQKCIKYTELKPVMDFDYKMFEKPVQKRGTNIIHKYGYEWCGGRCRWGTSDKISAIKKHCNGSYEYVGIAFDEINRIEKEKRENRILPLVDWQITEKECLEYCYAKGYNWLEKGVELYSILDRVSCYCCGFKNLKELKNIYQHLPEYWEKLKQIQSRLSRPMKGEGKSVFDLENKFISELKQQAQQTEWEY